MLDNHLYNLFCQLVQENKTLWRMSQYYMKDVAGCKECTDFWKSYQTDKEARMKELSELIERHIS